VTSLKTYSHLTKRKKIPSEYDLACSRLLYYTKKGFEVDVPLKSWYRERQQESLLQCDDWENFSDPRETTYTRYTDIQAKKEIFVDGILETIEKTNYDRGLQKYWIEILERLIAPLRYPWHGFQMIAAYIGQMAPSGKITVAAMFQAADEMRRIQRIAYRIAQLRLTYPTFGKSSLSLWQDDPSWQPLREISEKLLITYDWAEAFVGLNLVVKPLLDEFIMGSFGELARERGDSALSEIFFSLNQDCFWQRQWTEALTCLVIQDRPENAKIVQEWVEKWRGGAARSVKRLSEAVGQAIADYEASFERFLTSLGLNTRKT
jgi:toluene monooxygenase system protein E